MLTKRALGGALMGVLMMPAIAMAAPLVYFGEDLGLGEHARLDSTPNADHARNQFGGLILEGAMESFESFAPGTYAWTYDSGAGTWTPGNTLPFANTIGSPSTPISGTIYADTGTVIEVPTGTNGFGRYPTDGDKLFHTKAETVTFDFGREVYAFGFDGIDVGDFGGQLSVSTYYGDTLLQTLSIAHVLESMGGDVFFWGIVDKDSPFTKIVLNNSNGIDVIGLDRIIVGTLVTPIPAALPLMAAGVFALGWMRRRQAVRASA